MAHALYDFVLVNNIKDLADKNIKGEITSSVLYSNRSLMLRCFRAVCKEFHILPIFFGACHDTSYVRMLEESALDSAVINRSTLLYSSNVG
jgi:hypothetical protein